MGNDLLNENEVYYCIICYKDLTRSAAQARINHIKECSEKHQIKDHDLEKLKEEAHKKMLQRQKNREEIGYYDYREPIKPRGESRRKKEELEKESPLWIPQLEDVMDLSDGVPSTPALEESKLKKSENEFGLWDFHSNSSLSIGDLCDLDSLTQVPLRQKDMESDKIKELQVFDIHESSDSSSSNEESLHTPHPSQELELNQFLDRVEAQDFETFEAKSGPMTPEKDALISEVSNLISPKDSVILSNTKRACDTVRTEYRRSQSQLIEMWDKNMKQLEANYQYQIGQLEQELELKKKQLGEKYTLSETQLIHVEAKIRYSWMTESST